jgi:hypothetical protein
MLINRKPRKCRRRNQSDMYTIFINKFNFRHTAFKKAYHYDYTHTHTRARAQNKRLHQHLLLERERGFQVLTAVVMKCSVFWDIRPCGPLKIIRRSCLLSSGYLAYSWSWRCRWHVDPKCQLIFNRLHSAISQKKEIFNVKSSEKSRLQ